MGMLYFIEDPALKARTIEILKKLGVPTDAPYDKEEVYQRLLADKKATHDGITIVKVKTLGHAELETISYEEIKKML